MSRRFLVDLNVILDVLLDRNPHAEASSALWAAVESGEAEGLLAARCVTTLHYLAARAKGREFGDRCVAETLSVFSVAPIDAAVLGAALQMGWTDFEDAVCAAAAEASGCQFIATRDSHGFTRASCPALTPQAALLAIRSPLTRD